MPARSKSQLGFIYSKRNKYGSKKNTPKKWKWVWGKEWTDVDYKKLPEKTSEHIITKFDHFLNENYSINEDFLICNGGDIDGFFNEIKNNIHHSKWEDDTLIFMISGDEQTINKYKNIAKKYNVNVKFEV